jgi:bifunctional non-homologous end joining protein LigD
MLNRLLRVEPTKLSRCALPFDSPDWVFELKYDGFRAQAYVDDGNFKLISLRQNVHETFVDLRAALARTLKVQNAILDGAIVYLDSQGRSVLNAVTHRHAAPVFYAFDLLWLNGGDMRQQPLLSRKRTLYSLLSSTTTARLLYSHHIAERGREFFRIVCEQGLAGIVAKKRDGRYLKSGWLEIRNPSYREKDGRNELLEGHRAKARSGKGNK